MKRAFVFLFCLMLTISEAHAQAVALGQEIASVIKWKAAARGFAANDPRLGAAVGAVGGAVAEIAAGAVIAGTAPAWGAVLATAALSAAVGYGINALAGWLFNKDGTVTVTGAKPPTSGQEAYYWSVFPGNVVVTGTNLESTAQSAIMQSECGASSCNNNLTWNSIGISSRTIGSWFAGLGQTYTYTYDGYWSKPGTSSTWPRTVSVTGSPFPYEKIGSGTQIPVTDPAGGTTTKPVADALNDLTPDQKSKPLEPKVVADIADAAWRDAASKPDYAGIPYSISDPVIAADVTAARAANPSQAVATVGDLTQPISSTNPLSEPATSPTLNPGTNPAASQPLVNLGIDPVIGSPQLEATPTGADILRPLTGLMPDLKNYKVPDHVGECPKPTFELFGKSIKMDGQCSLFEDIRGQLYNAMIVVFLLIAMFIVLSA
ncbi:hypothetical protein GJ699_13630 [Duganella sp. FT80W]|uniref:TspB protein n=1 Tax=Duganella guangzhouensis TaxID=2666084 RepID=A0A6I2KYY2_9BURK|nr:hypothetical protein [Duganella guangzhouensis]MRW91031.1 hypothetical protein [Duganella guangzhouensis]